MSASANGVLLCIYIHKWTTKPYLVSAPFIGEFSSRAVINCRSRSSFNAFSECKVKPCVLMI